MAESNGKFTVEKFERVDDLLQGLKKDAREAAGQNDTFMVSVYEKLLAVCSPIVNNAKARLEREDRAAINKQMKELRKKDREAREAEKKARKANTQE